ncbi:MAG TPA: DUF190 domain-containing protein [Burkholderiaceae bacterium]
MKGFQVEFFTKQDLFHAGKHMSDWLVEAARSHGIRGATVFTGGEGFGQSRVVHAIHMFDIVDHSMQVTIVATEEECERFFAYLKKEKLHLFYVKVPVEFGNVGG